MARTNVRGGQVGNQTVSLDAGHGDGQDVVGTLAVTNGGTGKATNTLGALLSGNGTGALLEVAPGSNGQVLTVVGGVWASAAAAASGGRTFGFFSS